MQIKKVNRIHLFDENNNEYIDTRFGNGIFLLGHNDNKIKEKLKNQIDDGIMFGFKNKNEEMLIKKLKKNLHWFDDFILCNTGSESIMRAFRIARNYNSKNKICLLSSFWHGSYDNTQIKNEIEYTKEISSAGISKNILNEIILLPNNKEKIFEIIEKDKNEISMIFIEPIQQTVLNYDKSFLKELRSFCDNNNILLGFDEMITGFRLSNGGAQEYSDVYADIACYGKVIGLGLPIGIIGFTNKIKKSIESAKPPIRFGGTFSGNPLSCKGGLLLLERINNDTNIYNKINSLTKKLCDKVNNYIKENKINMQIKYFGSMYRFIFTNKEINSLEDRKKYEVSNKFQLKFYEILKNNNVIVGSNPLCFISNSHTEEDIELLIDIYINSIKEWNIKYLNKNESVYYFKKNIDKLEYVGNDNCFDELYNDINDPWNQSIKFNDNKITDYYMKVIKKYINIDDFILDIGCGTGESTNFINNIVKSKNLKGCDISKKAIEKAKVRFNNINFFVQNIKNDICDKDKFDVIILSSMIWYIVDDLQNCINNIIKSLKPNGLIIIQNIFLKEQKYASEVFNGIDGLKEFIIKLFNNKEIEFIECVRNNEIDKYWGCIIFKNNLKS